MCGGYLQGLRGWEGRAWNRQAESRRCLRGAVHSHFLHYSIDLQNMYMYSLKIKLIKNTEDKGHVSVAEADKRHSVVALRGVVEVR